MFRSLVPVEIHVEFLAKNIYWVDRIPIPDRMTYR